MTGKILLAVLIFWPMAAAIAAYGLGRNERIRNAFTLAVSAFVFVLSLLLALFYPGTELRLSEYGSITLHFRLDGFRSLFTVITAFLWLATTLFSPEYFVNSRNSNRYWLFNLFTLGSVMGVFLSADFFTAFLFFESMSFCSYAMVAHDESPPALRAAETYLAVAVIGGLAQLLGMILLQQRAGTLEFSGLYEVSIGLQDRSQFYLPGALLLAGFGAKAGMFPLHIWLPKAHPVAPAPASALLSGILIKTGVFGVALLSCNIFFNDYRWGITLLVPAVITMVLGAVLGVFSNDLKRTLACSSVSQIGFILTGMAMQVFLGEHNALAVRGTLLHMLNHSLFKLLLFVAAGVVYINRHELALDKIRGFGRGKKLFLFVFLMAGLGICGVPLWSGYLSKTLLHESIIEAILLYHGLPLAFFLQLTDIAFILTGALTVAYMTKLFVALFVEREEMQKEKSSYIKGHSAILLAFCAALLPLLGIFTFIFDNIAEWGQDFFHGHAPDHSVHYFIWANLKGAFYSLAIGMGIYFFVVRSLLMRRTEEGVRVHRTLLPVWLDLENLVYRPLLRFLVLMNLALRSEQKPHAPSGFLKKYYRLFRLQLQHLRKDSVLMVGSFSIDLFLAGLGICITLLYVFIKSFFSV